MGNNNLLVDFTNIDIDTVDTAVNNVNKGSAAFLVLSGKMGSGKDTIGPLALEQAGYVDIKHRSYADQLKNDVDQMLMHTRYLDNESDVQKYLESNAWSLSAEHSEVMAKALWLLAADVHTHSRVRSTPMRFLLQYYGTEARRSVDENYWVKPGLATMLTDLANNISVYVTDARFPNELTWPRSTGAKVVRLGITEETQKKRLESRDGLLPPEEAFNHPSELALDTYPDFDAVIAVDNLTIPQVVTRVVDVINQ